MGSPPAPHLANGWLSKFDKDIQGDSQVYERYIDDIIRTVMKDEVDHELARLNNLHPFFYLLQINRKKMVKSLSLIYLFIIVRATFHPAGIGNRLIQV